MRRINSAFLLLFIAGFVNLSFCNTTKLPGYIITHDSDTLEGTLLITDWNQSTFEGQFYENGSIDGIIITPLIVREFGVSDKIFKSAIVQVEQSPVKKSELSLTSDLYFVSDTTFLEVVISGKKELFFLKDDHGKDNFYINEGDSFTWLIHKIYTSNVEGRKGIMSNNNFIGQLILYLDGCSSMNKVLSGTTYDQKSLVKAFRYYFDCINSDMKEVKKEKDTRVELGALAGITATKIKFSGSGNEYLTDVNYPWSVNLTGGIAADILLPNILGRWSINNELVISYFNTKATYTSYVDENRYTMTQTQLGSTYLKLNNMFRANFLINYSHIYFDIGVFNGYAIGNKNYSKTTIVSQSSETVTEDVALDNMRKYEVGILVGIGFKAKKFSGTFRYEIGNGISGNKDLDSSMNRFYLLIGYRFM